MALKDCLIYIKENLGYNLFLKDCPRNLSVSLESEIIDVDIDIENYGLDEPCRVYFLYKKGNLVPHSYLLINYDEIDTLETHIDCKLKDAKKIFELANSMFDK